MRNLLGRDAKMRLGQGLLDLALILAVLRHSDISDYYPELGDLADDPHIAYEALSDEGPLLGITSTSPHHFQDNFWLEGSGYSLKSSSIQHDTAMDEYDRLMREIRSMPPVISNHQAAREVAQNPVEDRHEFEPGRDVIAMILSVPSNPQQSGGVQISNRFNSPLEGAVGGVGSSAFYAPEESFDLFSTFSPANMAEHEIDDLMLTARNGETDADNSADVRWQQYLSGYESMAMNQGLLPMCGYANNGSFGWGGGYDVLNEAILSSELFLPVNDNEQNRSCQNPPTFDVAPGVADNSTDSQLSTRLEILDTNAWESQNHENELQLFPSLPPPSYEEVASHEEVETSPADNNPQRYVDAIQDHNYFNTSLVDRLSEIGDRAVPNQGYAIRSRQQVSTRVISVAPRTRHISDVSSVGTETEIMDSASDAASDVSVREGSTRRVTVGSDSGVEGDMDFQNSPSPSESNSHRQFETEPRESSYNVHLIRAVPHRREVILCN